MRNRNFKAILFKSSRKRIQELREILRRFQNLRDYNVVEINTTSFYFYESMSNCKAIKDFVETYHPGLANEIIYPFQPKIGRARRRPLNPRIFVNICDLCTGWSEYVMLTSEIWNFVSNDGEHDFICLKCIEKKIKRKLTLEDFPRHIPVNEGFRSGWFFGAKNG